MTQSVLPSFYRVLRSRRCSIYLDTEDVVNVNFTRALLELFHTVKANWLEDYYLGESSFLNFITFSLVAEKRWRSKGKQRPPIRIWRPFSKWTTKQEMETAWSDLDTKSMIKKRDKITGWAFFSIFADVIADQDGKSALRHRRPFVPFALHNATGSDLKFRTQTASTTSQEPSIEHNRGSQPISKGTLSMASMLIFSYDIDRSLSSQKPALPSFLRGKTFLGSSLAHLRSIYGSWTLVIPLMGFIRFLLDFTEFFSVSLGFTRFYWVLLGFTGFLLGFTEFFSVSLGFTRYY